MERGFKLTTGQIAELVGGHLLGSDDIQIAGVASLDRAAPGDLSFLASAKYIPYFERTHAGAVLVTPELQGLTTGPATRIVVSDTHKSLATVLRALHPQQSVAWGVALSARIGRGARWCGRVFIGPGAVLGEDVQLGEDCQVGPAAVIERGATLGHRCRVGPHVVVCSGAQLGNNVVLKSGSRVGTPGYAFAESPGGHVHIPHVGGCYLGDDVEVGANTTIDRGSLGDTVIGAGTKIDNLVQIAHNVRIGERCLIMAQVGLAGSTIIEDDVMLAGQAGLAGHLTVGRGARVAAQAGVIGDVPAGTTVSGYPARSHREVLRQTAALQRLSQIVTTLERMVETQR